MNQLPLQGIKVLDFTQALAGVFCSMYLGDFGADIMKIERIGTGDQSREWGPFKNDFSAYFAAFNRNKKSIAMNLCSQEAKDIILRMVKDADIVLENFKAGTMEKMGLGYDTLKEINPRLIYGSISGFGLTGSLCGRPCYDITASGFSGLISRTGEAGGPPIKPGFSVGDNWAGTNLLFGVTMALVQRQATGKGSRLDIAMLDGLFYTLEQPLLEYADKGKISPKNGNLDPDTAPNGILKTKDGYVGLGCISDKQFVKTCEILGVPSLAKKPEYATNEDRVAHNKQLMADLEAVTVSMSKLDIERELNGNRVAASAVKTIRELVEDDEQIKARDMVVPIHHPVMGDMHAVGIPMKMSETPGDVTRLPAPQIGEHTEETLLAIGYTEEDIQAMVESGAISVLAKS